MNKLKYTLIISAFSLISLPVAAQVDNYTIDEDEIPYGLLEEADESDANSYIDKTYLSPLDEDVELDDVNPFFPDEYFIERLKAIPGPEEFQVYNGIVRSYIDRYATRLRRSVSNMLGRYNLYANLFDDVLYRYDIPEILNYLPVIESAINPTAKSHAGASGLWQFMPSTGKSYGLDINSWVDERNDPYRSTEAAAKYLRNLYDTYGNWCLVLAAYNCGPGNVNRAIARAGGSEDYWTIYPYLPKETRGYVPAFIAAAYIMNNYSQHNIKPRKAAKAVVLDTSVVHYDLRMEQIAKACEIEVDEIKGFNPQYRSTFIPGGRRRCTIALPQELSVRFAGVEDSIYRSGLNTSESLTVQTDSTAVGQNTDSADDSFDTTEPTYTRNNSSYSSRKSKSSRNSRANKRSSSRGKSVTVRSGDSLSKIAKRNHTTVAKLRRLNGMKGDRLRAGQKLKVK